MSKTLIQEGLKALSEISPIGLSPSYSDRSRDTRRLKTVGGLPDGNAINFGFDRPQSPELAKHVKRLGYDNDYKEYRDDVRKEDGSVNIHHGSNDSGYVEFNRNNYADPYGDEAKRHEREILDAGGLRTSSGSIIFQDPFQQRRAFEKLRNTLSRQRRPK